ncbi:hypothetical protein Smp_133950 [Schistosoma mansoni]|uniref:hypothetical protein n=1 Tax=Schistosoma mansoni TaxID=6183 RepID=UPI00022DC003|nr:hypothetical protein Smp_133950 [Schistosoma mansoni]|eukprot:XP_018649659.1 hypothetical protein Smp_133950 [Schistosoma mansoni]
MTSVNLYKLFNEILAIGFRIELRPLVKFTSDSYKSSREKKHILENGFSTDFGLILFGEIQGTIENYLIYETLKTSFKKLHLQSRLNVLTMEPKLKEKQRLDAIMIDENELKEHKSTVRQYDLIPVEEKANILKLKIINELESKYREQILCLQSDLQYYQDQNRLLIDTNQNLNKTLNDEQQMNKLRNEFMNQCQVSVDSTKNQVRSELQIEQFINSTRTELFDLRNEVQTQRFEIENQRNELMNKSKVYANSLMEKINATESKQSSLILTDRHNQRILKHLDISNAIRNKMQQFVEDSRKKRALCLRIVLLKRKLNFFEYEMEKLRQENNNLKRNVSISEYERVCMAYKDLYRRHQEYERIILHSDNQKFLIKSNTLQ